MKHIKGLLALALLPIMATATFAKKADEPSIVDIAGANPAFSTLVAAVVKADLVTVLDGNRQFTVFAPTNDAFDAAAEAVLGEGATGVGLVDALDAETLKSILLYHVAPGKRLSGDVLDSTQIRTVAGDFFGVNGLTLEGNNSNANLVIGLIDIEARNGVIHVIDFVLLP